MLKRVLYALLRREPLLQDWVLDLPGKYQASLVASLRGNDNYNGSCKECKDVTKMLRYLIVNNIGKKNSYMSNHVMHMHKVIDYLIKMYPTNKHWVEHVLSAGYQVSRNHPNSYVRSYWGGIVAASNTRIDKWKKKEKQRIETEKYINRVIAKYTDIYYNRSI